MTNLNLAREAARNNALWCETMCKAHDVPSELHEKVWVCRGVPPRFHPSAATLQPGAGDEILDLMPPGFKDGFCDIEWAEERYQLLFEASWIHLPEPPTISPTYRWKRILHASELSEWESWWAHGDVDAQNFPPQFPDCLLKDENNAFMAGYDGSKFVGGCILNRTSSVVGMSNTFAIENSLSDLWIDLARVPSLVFPGVTVVGYERDQDLECALAAGFKSVGPLRVWWSGKE